MARARAGRRSSMPPGNSRCDRFSNQFTGQTGQRDAVARESLQVIHIGLEATEIRGAIERYVEQASPGVLDTRAGELGKHAQHARAQARRSSTIEMYSPAFANTLC